jgi:hypothetical protein
VGALTTARILEEAESSPGARPALRLVGFHIPVEIHRPIRRSIPQQIMCLNTYVVKIIFYRHGPEIRPVRVQERPHFCSPRGESLTRATGMSWEHCAELLYHNRIIPRRLSEEEIFAVRRAADFWDRLAVAQKLYGAIVRIGELPRFRGRFGYFGKDALKELLPGISIPKHLERNEYLTRLIPADRQGKGLCFDVHSVKGQPLFRHPFA